jgi:addiction module HigA family antidote
MTQMFRFDAAQTPLSPGRILRERLLEGMQLTQAQLARAIGICKPRLNMILKGRCQISAEIALRIERVFDISPQYWLRARSDFELFEERQRMSSELDRLRPISDRRGCRASAWPSREWQAAA